MPQTLDEKMKTESVILAFGLCIGCAFAQEGEPKRLQETKFLRLQDKPATTIHVTPADAEAFWKRLTPPGLADKPEELKEFKRTHAHKFWEPYLAKKITVSGAHYCACCFEAAIGVAGKGYTKGWTVRLDDYIAIGFPEGSTAYTEDGKSVPMKGSLRPVEPIVQAVGSVTGPVSITENLWGSQALAYFVLEQ